MTTLVSVNVTVETYKGNEPNIVILRKLDQISIMPDQTCTHLFGPVYKPEMHFCIGHMEPKHQQEYIPPGTPIYGYYNTTDGRIFHDVVGMRWRIVKFGEYYFALCLRLYFYIQWVIDTLNNDKTLAKN